ncbi:MAG: CDGSH iron-sulfur domain-containing protein [Cyanobacteria bacterium REEB65]|nr:CDGSH iron-sulfur domain-containing protein [Cyanobacteria bacterium REEB65]
MSDTENSNIVCPHNNGPYEVTFAGPFQVVTDGGKALPVKGNKIWLCRCGQSKAKPFCDGTHKRVDFQSNLD